MELLGVLLKLHLVQIALLAPGNPHVSGGSVIWTGRVSYPDDRSHMSFVYVLELAAIGTSRDSNP